MQLILIQLATTAPKAAADPPRPSEVKQTLSRKSTPTVQQQLPLQQLEGSEMLRTRSTKGLLPRTLKISTTQWSLSDSALITDKSTGSSRTVGELAGAMVRVS